MQISTHKTSINPRHSILRHLTKNAPVAHLLIKAGCDVALRDACGQTAEEVAKVWSNLDFLQIMREKDENYKLELEQRRRLFAKHGGELLQLKTFQDIIDSSDESLRMSGTLNEFLSCLISTPGIGTVIKDPEAGEIWDVVDRFASNVVKTYSRQSSENALYPVPRGQFSRRNQDKIS